MISSALGRRGLMLTSVGGLGLMRPASGTWGSLPPAVLAWVMLQLGLGPRYLAGAEGAQWGAAAWIGYHLVLTAVLVFFSVVCAAYGDAAEAKWGKKDPGQVVADETAGMCLPLMLLPASSVATPGSAALTLGLALVAFRVFDVIKLPPAHGIQRVPGGWGILLDDLVAGVQAMVVVQVVTRAIL